MPRRDIFETVRKTAAASRRTPRFSRELLESRVTPRACVRVENRRPLDWQCDSEGTLACAAPSSIRFRSYEPCHAGALGAFGSTGVEQSGWRRLQKSKKRARCAFRGFEVRREVTVVLRGVTGVLDPAVSETPVRTSYA